jgi:MerR family transcriptional regulator, thiopeptide resistance regulator
MLSCMKRRTYQVKEVAELAGVSVRALHHYDEIGLLVPRARTDGGYRLYDDEDLLRLQQILVGRELGLSLEEIRRSLDDPRFDRRSALHEQRRALEARAGRTAAMIRAVDHALAALATKEGETTMDAKELFEGFDPSRYEAEAAERWGGTAPFEESRRRTRGYTPDDWKRHAAQQAAVYEDAAALLRAGRPAASREAMDVAERHRLLIDRWFYPCAPKMHAGLADLYEADARFAANIDKFGEGLTPFLVAAIRANAARGH